MSTALTTEELARYSRHIRLQEIGLEGQQKLKAASVLVIGAGGLGCPVLQYLCAAGVGTIGIIDFDRVDASNLQRQILYAVSDVGEWKAIAAARHLSAQNPFVRFNSYTEALSKDNALEIIRPYDMVVDGSDTFSTRYLVNDACVLLNKPLVFGSIFKFDGQVSVFNHTDAAGRRGPTYRCLYPEPPAAGEMPSCSEIGVLGVLPGIIGTLQANEVLKLITGTGTVLSGKLFTIDALTLQTALYDIQPDVHHYNITDLGDYEEETCTPVDVDVPESLTVHQLHALLTTTPDVLLLDVRETFEYDICRLKGALLMPMNTVPQRFNDLPKHEHIVVYCHHGMRSAQVQHFLKSQGFEKIYNLEGGIHAWATEIEKTMAVY